MITTLNKGFLKEQRACADGFKWFCAQPETETAKVLSNLIAEDHLAWAAWVIKRVLVHKKYVIYSVFAAEQVIEIFEEKYPEDKRPRIAIEAAKKWISEPLEKNRKAAYSAYKAAYNAAYSASAACAACAAYAAYAADDADAADAADAAYNAAYNAAYSADAAYSAYSADAASARKELQIKILNHGIKLLNREIIC